MKAAPAAEQKRRIRLMFSDKELRATFAKRTDDEMFFAVGKLKLGAVKTAALMALGLGHVVVWEGYEYLNDVEVGEPL